MNLPNDCNKLDIFCVYYYQNKIRKKKIGKGINQYNYSQKYGSKKYSMSGNLQKNIFRKKIFHYFNCFFLLF